MFKRRIRRRYRAKLEELEELEVIPELVRIICSRVKKFPIMRFKGARLKFLTSVTKACYTPSLHDG
jgi:hypothetical protein